MATIKNNQALAYLETAEIQGRIPNFWMSREYIERALHCSKLRNILGFSAKGDFKEWFLPPLKNGRDFFYTANIFADFLWNYVLVFPPRNHKFLDHQFIYDPKNFLSLAGSKLAVFRKNIRKYPTRHSTDSLLYQKIEGDVWNDEISSLLLKWAGDKEFYDNEVLIRFCLEGENRWGLFSNGNLIGLNVWDENYLFVNYRYCIDTREPFLNELLRWYFYTSEVIQNKNKLVNDGGCLGSNKLKAFKMKLNPVRIYNVYSVKGEPPNED